MQFKLLTLATLFLATGVLSIANPVAEANAVAERELVARACVADGCSAPTGTKQGQYCGYCSKVRGHAISDNIYELSPAGKCCKYGASTKCKQGSQNNNQAYCDGVV